MQGFMGSKDCVVECDLFKGEWKTIFSIETLVNKTRSSWSGRSCKRVKVEQNFIVRVEALDSNPGSQCPEELDEFFVSISISGKRYRKVIDRNVSASISMDVLIVFLDRDWCRRGTRFQGLISTVFSRSVRRRVRIESNIVRLYLLQRFFWT